MRLSGIVTKQWRLGFEVHPEFLKLLEPHRGKKKKKPAARDEERKVPERKVKE